MHTVLPLVKAGRLKMLAVMSKERAELAPNVLTFKEQGYPKLQVDVWYALLAPKGTPAGLVQELNTQVMQILKAPNVVSQLSVHGIEANPSASSTLADLLKMELGRWTQVVKTAQIKAD